MIKHIYFIDENITGRTRYSDVDTIDCADGYRNNIKKLKRLINSRDYYDILTNQTAFLKSEYCWDKVKKRPNIYFPRYDEANARIGWFNVEEFTVKEIRYNTNIEEWFRRGEFDNYIGKKRKKRG